MSDAQRDAIAKMIAQKKLREAGSKDTVAKKEIPVTKKKIIKKQVTPESSIESNELQNLMELIDIKKIVRNLVQEELARLGVSKKCQCPVPEDEYIDDPMDVDLVRIDNTKDLAIVNGQVRNVLLPVVVDSASNKDIIPKLIADELGLEIDTSITHNIRGASGKNKSLG